MAHEFLSDAWLDAVAALGAGVPDPPAGGGHPVVNLVVTDCPFGERRSHLVRGRLERGLAEGAATTLTVPYDVAKALFVDLDPAAGLQAYVAGRMKVEGDMTRLLDVQTAADNPSEAQRTFHRRLQELTA